MRLVCVCRAVQSKSPRRTLCIGTRAVPSEYCPIFLDWSKQQHTSWSAWCCHMLRTDDRSTQVLRRACLVVESPASIEIEGLGQAKAKSFAHTSSRNRADINVGRQLYS